ncbi:MAG: hypothetical protein ACRD0F_00915 [Acidimicrobiales bacterium]
MRVSGDFACRTVRAWVAGLLDSAPELVDHAIVGAALGHGRNGWGAALLMRDVSAELLPAGDLPIPADQHTTFIDHLAGFCAATWGWRPVPACSRTRPGGRGSGARPSTASGPWGGRSRRPS